MVMIMNIIESNINLAYLFVFIFIVSLDIYMFIIIVLSFFELFKEENTDENYRRALWHKWPKMRRGKVKTCR
jgi:hypothetical protein